MAGYFIDIVRDNVVFVDNDGVTLADPAELRIEVCRQVGEIMRDWVPGTAALGLDVLVRDPAGITVMSARLSFECSEPGLAPANHSAANE